MSHDISDTINDVAYDLHEQFMGFEKIFFSPVDYIRALEEFADLSRGMMPGSGLGKLKYHTAFGEVELLKSSFPSKGTPGEIVIDVGCDRWAGAAIKNGPLWQPGGPCLYRTRWSAKVIIVTSVKLLVASGGYARDQRRDDDYRMWSPAVVKQLSKSAQQVLVLHDTDLSFKAPRDNLDQFIKSLNIHNIEVQEYPGVQHDLSLEIWKKRIMRFGAIIYEGSQTSSGPQCLAFSSDSDHITFVGEGGSEKLGIFREIQSKFLELAKERERKAIW